MVPLEELLRAFSLGSDGSDGSDNSDDYWSETVLRAQISRDRIKDQLKRDNIRRCRIQEYADRICPKDGLTPISNNSLVEISNGKDEYVDNGEPKHYFRIFGILVMINRGKDIGDFIETGVCDEALPLERFDDGSPGRRRLSLRKQPHKSLEIFKRCGWTPHEVDAFYKRQWGFLVPHLRLASDNKTARDVVFRPMTMMPLEKTKEPIGEGGNGRVFRATIPRECHDFHDVPHVKLANGVFALKQLRINKGQDSEEAYENEAKILRTFNGFQHDNLVTLLMTYKRGEGHFFLFPLARQSLLDYWTSEKAPFDDSNDFAKLDWFYGQILGITEALAIFHKADHLAEGEPRYGRHGDLKPENILYYPPQNSREGRLVIADMGTSELNRTVSKSKVTNTNLPYTREYQPPECHRTEVKINRKYDIWTFGCLLLETLTWLLGGESERKAFQEERKSTHPRGVQSPCFWIAEHLPGDLFRIFVNGNVIKVSNTDD
jgi:hypothetical protein